MTYADAEYQSWFLPPRCVICDYPEAVRTPLMRNELVCRMCYITWYDTGETKGVKIRELSLAARESGRYK